MTAVGVVGLGVVGSAVRDGLSRAFRVETYDNAKPSSCSSLVDMAERARVVFVCVPTPETPGTGAANTGAVSDVVRTLARQGRGTTIVIKSTVPPGTTDALDAEVAPTGARVLFQPEFLTEARAAQDFLEQDRVIVGAAGGDLMSESVAQVAHVFERVFPGIRVVGVPARVAEMVKYVTNTFLMTKVLFCNEMAEVAAALGVDWDEVWPVAAADPRLGASHWRVPGPDGKRGAGGACFPKDIRALAHVARAAGVEPDLLQAVMAKNAKVRP